MDVQMERRRQQMEMRAQTIGMKKAGKDTKQEILKITVLFPLLKFTFDDNWFYDAQKVSYGVMFRERKPGPSTESRGHGGVVSGSYLSPPPGSYLLTGMEYYLDNYRK